MKIHIATLLLVISSLTASAQTLENFKTDFESALDTTFSQKRLDTMFRTYNELLTPHSEITRFTASIVGDRLPVYPLADFKASRLYTANIKTLLHSANANQRLLAYLVIASAGDTTMEALLLPKLRSETGKGNLTWAAMALMYLNTSHTTPLFDFLVANEDFADAHMLPLFIKLNPDSLQQTAYIRIKSTKLMARVLAAQVLAEIPLNAKIEELLKQAVFTWDISIKGYAIYSIAKLKIGNLMPAFKPLLNNPKTRSITLQALANSPTPADRQYLLSLVPKNGAVPDDLLNCFLNSGNVAGVKHWLRLMSTRTISGSYYFSVPGNATIMSDSLLSSLQQALIKITNKNVRGELLRALDYRKDEVSTAMLVGFLNDTDSSVRYWAARALTGNTSPLVLARIPAQLKLPQKRELALTKLAISNKIDTLHNIYDNIYRTTLNREWKRSAIEYYSAFPELRYKLIFVHALKDKLEDSFTKRIAAMGLAKLHDDASADLIIAACRDESKDSDYNARVYLQALGILKGDKAKAEIERFKDSRDEGARQLALGLLKDW
jgi:HEAT repeat protein